MVLGTLHESDFEFFACCGGCPSVDVSWVHSFLLGEFNVFDDLLRRVYRVADSRSLDHRQRTAILYTIFIISSCCAERIGGVHFISISHF